MVTLPFIGVDIHLLDVLAWWALLSAAFTLAWSAAGLVCGGRR